MQPDSQQRILDLLRTDQHGDAVAAAREAVAGEPQDAQAHRLLSMALRASGDAEGARASMDAAIALAPDDADLHFHRAGLLLGARDIEAAQAALSRSVTLDPNQFGAYIMQAQLALGRGDLDEAARIARLAERVAPDHPWLKAVEGTLALRRGDADGALAMLAKAAEQAPEDVQLRYALGFAYLAKQHHAFAEQAFRGVLEKTPEATNLHGLLAELLQRQGRYAEAVDELAPLLADERTATPALRRFAGELELMAGRHEPALPHLRAALAAAPGDRRTLQGLVEAWRRNGDDEDARNTLDAALATSPAADDLWQARLMFEPAGVDADDAVIERWLAQRPDSVRALEAGMALHAARGEGDAAEAVAGRILALEPGHSAAEMCIFNAKLQRDPADAIAHLEGLLAKAPDEDNRRLLRSWIALTHDRAGDPARAAGLWLALAAEVADRRLPLPEATTRATGDLADAAPVAEGAPSVAFLVGLPGSLVEQLAVVLSGSVESFRADRFGGTPPTDLLQNYDTPAQLASGAVDVAAVADSWRQALTTRGVPRGEVVDWLLWWDNAFASVLRQQVPHAHLLIALRDPRDMLLDWIAFGAPMPLRMTSATEAARWMAAALDQVADLHDADLVPHSLLRLDDIVNDAPALSQALGEALQTPLPEPADAILGPPHFKPGHWRAYAQPLAEAFALLAPVARRLGYPAD